MEKVLSTVLSSPDSYQEIEAALTEMESCMKLLFPEFDVTDIQSRLQSSPAACECPSIDEQPCCSRDLVVDGKETMIKERQEEENGAEEKRAKDEPMTEQEESRRQEGNTEAAGKEGEEEENEDEEERRSEDEDDSFIRSSGLVSHSYSLDLNISRGGFND